MRYIRCAEPSEKKDINKGLCSHAAHQLVPAQHIVGRRVQQRIHRRRQHHVEAGQVAVQDARRVARRERRRDLAADAQPLLPGVEEAEGHGLPRAGAVAAARREAALGGGAQARGVAEGARVVDEVLQGKGAPLNLCVFYCAGSAWAHGHWLM